MLEAMDAKLPRGVAKWLDDAVAAGAAETADKSSSSPATIKKVVTVKANAKGSPKSSSSKKPAKKSSK